MIERVLTIGVYGKTESDFFDALRNAEVDTFCDIRMRRGVRGSQYAFVNSTKLQSRLAAAGIKYIHEQNLAPTQRIRELQHRADDEEGITKRTRQELGPTFKSHYAREILAPFDTSSFKERISSSRRLALFCVEGTPGACHRSLVAERLKVDWNVPVEHL
jgi:uncharacterized protein (DUF488 family)